MRGSVRRRLRTIANRTVPRSLRVPKLSVVIPVHNVAPYLRACLDSVLEQSLQRIEVIAVDDGSDDGSAAILDEYAARDPRVRVVHQANAGQGAARNAGVGLARGVYLTFVDADDLIPEDAFAFQVAQLTRSGSDFSIGSIRRLGPSGFGQPFWVPIVHGRDRIGVTIDDSPEAMLDVIACNRVIRRAFWLEHVGGFRVGRAYEDHVPMVLAFLRAARFDVLQRVTYTWRIRDDGTSTSQGKAQLQNLLDRLAVKSEAEAIVTAEASPKVRAWWVARVLDMDLSLFVAFAPQSDENYRRRLQEAMAHYVGLADETTWGLVRVQQKVRCWLAAADDWSALAAFEEYLDRAGPVPPAVVDGGRVLARVLAPEVTASGLPTHLLELSSTQTTIGVQLDGLAWTASELIIEGYAFIKNVDLAAPPTIGLVALEPRAGRRIEAVVEPRRHAGPGPAGTRQADYARGSFRATLPLDSLAGAEPGQAWSLEFRVAVGSVVREGPALDHVYGSSASPAHLTSAFIDGLRLAPRWDPAAGLVIDLPGDDLIASMLTVADRRVSGAIDRLGCLEVVAACDGHHVRTPITSEGTWTLTIPPGPARRWHLRVVRVDETSQPLQWPRQGPTSAGLRGSGSIAAAPDSNHAVVVDSDFPILALTGLAPGTHGLAATFESTAVSPGLLATLALDDRRQRHLARETKTVGASTSSTLPEDGARWTGGALPLGRYRLTMVDDNGGEVPVIADPAYLATLPVEVRTSTHLWRVVPRPDRSVELVALPPLAQDERGPRAQQRLHEAFRTGTMRDAVYFDADGGAKVDGSQLALFRALREQSPGTTVFWGVSSPATPVPDGASPVLIGSREWYDVVGSARCVCTDAELPAFFARGPEQLAVLLDSTRPLSRAGDVRTPSVAAREGARARQLWTGVVLPDASTAALVHNPPSPAVQLLTGYPRCDRLVAGDSTARHTLLGSAGVQDRGQLLVLLDRTAGSGPDPQALAAVLPTDALVLDLGPGGPPAGGVLDVGDHPDIGILMLAADVAVLGDTWLRFDWAVTRKPFVMHEPADPTPAEVVTTVSGIAARLADLDALSVALAKPVKTFNTEHNPHHDGGSTLRVLSHLTR